LKTGLLKNQIKHNFCYRNNYLSKPNLLHSK
jgi:hypothetical protein